MTRIKKWIRVEFIDGTSEQYLSILNYANVTEADESFLLILREGLKTYIPHSVIKIIEAGDYED